MSIRVGDVLLSIGRLNQRFFLAVLLCENDPSEAASHQQSLPTRPRIDLFGSKELPMCTAYRGPNLRRKDGPDRH